jgi:hypothetical protein
MQPNHNSLFATWELTIEEQAAGETLQPEQIAVIQNDIAEAAAQKVGLKYDPTNSLQFLQKEAELAGRILILQYLLSRSASAQERLMEIANQVLQSNNLHSPEDY